MAQADTAVVAQLQVPEPVRERLGRLVAELGDAAGTHLVALMVYGGIARGRYAEHRSDVNLFLLLERADAALLGTLARPLHEGWRALRVDPMIVTVEELPRVAALFPVKLLDIQRHHIVLTGNADSLRSLTVPMELARVRVEQELRNLELRIRRRYIAVSTSPDEQLEMVATIIRSLAISLAGLLEVDDRVVPPIDRTRTILESAAEAYNLDRATLTQLATLRETSRFDGEPGLLVDATLTLIHRAAAIAAGAGS